MDLLSQAQTLLGCYKAHPVALETDKNSRLNSETLTRVVKMTTVPIILSWCISLMVSIPNGCEEYFPSWGSQRSLCAFSSRIITWTYGLWSRLIKANTSWV